MRTSINTINNNKEEVNTKSLLNKKELEKDFLTFVEEESYKPDLWEDFYKLIPDIHKSAVAWKVRKQFNGNAFDYIKKHKLFAEKFTKEMKDTADSKIELQGKDKRNTKKKKKEFLLYSAQLLGLVGKNGSSYLNEGLLKHFQDDMKEQEDYLKTLRLVDKHGKIKALSTLEDKQRRKIAQILNIASCLDQIAKDRTEAGEEYTYNLITLTLPASYHASPAKGKNSFNGVMPLKAHGQLHQYWRLIRANLAKLGLRAGRDYFGMQTVEAHKDSTLHLHCVLFFPKRLQDEIENIVSGVANRSKEKVNFDISKNNGKAGAATYIFKYITKTNAIYSDDTAIKNTALRWYYSARGFNFFGIDSAISKFNFVIQNRNSYKDFFCDELNRVLDSFDYYTFITKYSKFFKSVRYKSKIDFVVYNLDGNEEGRFTKSKTAQVFSQHIVIKRIIYNIFEKNNNVTDLVKNVHQLDKNDVANSSIFTACDIAKNNDASYKVRIDGFKVGSGLTFISVASKMKIDLDVDMVEELNGETSFSSSLVTVIPSCSSADQSADKKEEEKEVYSPRFSKKLNEMIRKRIEENRKTKGLEV